MTKLSKLSHFIIASTKSRDYPDIKNCKALHKKIIKAVYSIAADSDCGRMPFGFHARPLYIRHALFQLIITALIARGNGYIKESKRKSTY